MNAVLLEHGKQIVQGYQQPSMSDSGYNEYFELEKYYYLSYHHLYFIRTHLSYEIHLW